MSHTAQGRSQYADAYTLTAHTHTQAIKIQFILSTYLTSPVGPHVL